MTFRLARREKYAAIILSGASRVAFQGNIEVGNGLWVLHDPPVNVAEHWRGWIGTIRADDIEKANLWIVSKRISRTPEVIDAENQQLGESVNLLFHALLIAGPPSYQHGYVLAGANPDGQPEIRQFGDQTPRYLKSFGAQDSSIGPKRVQSAHRIAAGLTHVFADVSYMRLRRGIRAFFSGLAASPPQDRVHQFIQTVESVTKPRSRGTAVDIAERSRTFINRSSLGQRVVRECYDLRSAIEHFRDELNVLSAYPAAMREELFYRRVRQSEALARHVLIRILSSPSMWPRFADPEIDKFWNQAEAIRVRQWGRSIEIGRVR